MRIVDEFIRVYVRLFLLYIVYLTICIYLTILTDVEIFLREHEKIYLKPVGLKYYRNFAKYSRFNT